MKKDHVPQDGDNMLEGAVKKVVYAVDQDGTYQKVSSEGWEPENIALSQAWEVINEKVEQARTDVAEGRLSPIAYHMEKNIMTPSLVADYMGFSSKKVKKHMEPACFNKLDEATLKKYAEVFQITLSELLKTD